MNNRDKLDLMVTKFISTLENDQAGDWIKPWTTSLPMNYSTKKYYRGMNIISLNIENHQYKSNQWLTFNQAKKLGKKIKKGEKGTSIFFYQLSKIKEDNLDSSNKKETLKNIPILKSYTVFNIEQVEGIEIPLKAQVEPLEEVEEFIVKTGVNIQLKEDRAYYVPSSDYINIPNIDSFNDTDNYYATLLHELSHWTGHKSRLHRNLSGSFGSESYAFEELVAELSSAFLCSHFDINLEKAQHPEYLQSWISALKEKPSILWKASSKAQEVFDYLLEITESSNAEMAA